MSETSTTSQKITAEFLGTFLLVFLGCGAVVMSAVTQSPVGYLAIALAFGFALLVGIYAFGRVSGAHFNPAVSVGAAMSGRMSWGQVPAYAAAQVSGGIVGAGLLFVVTQALPEGSLPEQTLGQNFFGNGGFSWWGALLVEVVLTAVLVTVILAVTDARNEHPSLAPLTIGVSLVVIHLFAIPLTGTSVNPARSIGPALFTGTDSLKDLWLFIVAPLVGAAAAGLSYPALFGHGSEPVAGSGLALGRPAAGTLGAPVAATPGYGAPDQFQQEWNQQAYGAEATPTYEPEPIIQDGWQWDHQAQEWKPLEHWTDPADRALATAPYAADQPAADQPAADQPTGTTPLEPGPLDHDTAATPQVPPSTPSALDPTQQPWDPGDDQTRIRRSDEP